MQKVKFLAYIELEINMLVFSAHTRFQYYYKFIKIIININVIGNVRFYNLYDDKNLNAPISKKIKNAYINVVQYLNPLLSLVLLLGNIFMLYKKTIIHPNTVMGNLSRNVLQWFCVPEH